MLYDHWLSQHWQRFSSAPLPRFLAQSYGQLLLDHHSLPQGLPMALRRMAEQNWLASYQYREGVGAALNGIGRRLRRPVPLGEALHALDQARWTEAEHAFLHFYPELMRFCEAQIAAHRTATSSPP